jgi:hypothetical protein
MVVNCRKIYVNFLNQNTIDQIPYYKEFILEKFTQFSLILTTNNLFLIDNNEIKIC